MSQVKIQTLFFLRWVQMGSTLITGFIACYLVWWHNRYNEDIPYGLSVMICASIATVVENYISQASALSTSGPVQLNHSRIFKTVGVTTGLLAYGYYALFTVPDINFSVFCDMDEYSRMYGRTVERRNCTLACDIIVAGAIAVAFSAFMTLFAMVNIYFETKARKENVEEAVSECCDFTVGSYSDDEKKGLDA